MGDFLGSLNTMQTDSLTFNPVKLSSLFPYTTWYNICMAYVEGSFIYNVKYSTVKPTASVDQKNRGAKTKPLEHSKNPWCIPWPVKFI